MEEVLDSGRFPAASKTGGLITDLSTILLLTESARGLVALGSICYPTELRTRACGITLIWTVLSLAM